MSGKPLNGRLNIVITRQQDWESAGALKVDSLNKALEIAQNNDYREVFIIGGGEIYQQGLVYTDKIEITKVHGHFDADTFFPSFDESQWKITTLFEQPIDEKHSHGFTVYRYTK